MMITTLKEKPGGYYCAECRMSIGEPVDTCPFCGSWISNYEDILVQEITRLFALEETKDDEQE